jgi:hypothetical protein
VGSTLFDTFHPAPIPGPRNELVELSLPDASLHVLPTSSALAGVVVANARAVYWVGFGAALTINETPLDGGPPVTLATPPTNSLGDLVLGSDGTLYWTTDTQLQAMKPPE